MTKAIIFDLDSCLAAADEVVVVRTGVCGHPRGQRRSLTGFCEPSAWCGIWYLTYFVIQSISTPHQPLKTLKTDMQEGKIMPKAFVTQSISQPHQPLKNNERAHAQR